jgi:hypothetical protein
MVTLPLMSSRAPYTVHSCVGDSGGATTTCHIFVCMCVCVCVFVCVCVCVLPTTVWGVSVSCGFPRAYVHFFIKTRYMCWYWNIVYLNCVSFLAGCLLNSQYTRRTSARTYTQVRARVSNRKFAGPSITCCRWPSSSARSNSNSAVHCRGHKSAACCSLTGEGARRGTLRKNLTHPTHRVCDRVFDESSDLLRERKHVPESACVPRWLTRQ